MENVFENITFSKENNEIAEKIKKGSKVFFDEKEKKIN